MHLLYTHSTRIGYGRNGVKLAEALARAGIKIDEELTSESEPHATACWVSQPSHVLGYFEGQHTVMATMWETNLLPEGFREAMDGLSQIIVPSKQNLELFSRYHPNVAQVPLGVDTSEWFYRKRTPPADRFIFLVGGGGVRKGADLAHRAFRKVWPNDNSWPSDMPRPTLIMKSPKPPELLGNRIEYVGGYLTDEAERDLYGMAHCYLQPSRGEGWGLQPLQAMAQGCPTILTDAHGQAEFAHLGLPISAGLSKAAYFIYGDAGDWWEPSLDELCERMEWVYNHYDEACANAERSAKVVAETLSWDHCAERFIEVVGRDRLNGTYAGSGRWVKPEPNLYLTRVVKPWRAEVAGNIYHLYPGKDYWLLSDVKRILFESGVLDASCVIAEQTGPLTEAETGLAPHQLEKLGILAHSQEWCRECGQWLNSGRRYEPEFDDDDAG